MKATLSTKTVIRTMVIAVLLPLIFVVAFVNPSHKPAANGLPIAVAGPPAAVQPLLQSLGDVRLVRVSGAAAARHAVRDRSAYGATAAGAHPSVDVASGGSFVVATMLRQDAVATGVAPEQITDLAPLPSGDPRGVTLNLVALGLLVAAILGATIIVATLRDVRPGQTEAVLAAVALAAGAATAGVLKTYGMLPGPFAIETAEFAGVILAVSLTAAGLVRLRGQMGTSLAFLFFVVLANPGSGLASAPDLLPTPWKQLGSLTPPGAGGQAIRGSAFFGGAADLGPILVLIAWIALGTALNALGYRQTRRKADATEQPAPTTEHNAQPNGRAVAPGPQRVAVPLSK